ncbi:MAG: LUD domain-containing protein, partial [Prevotella sp.]|nr:LUD domain-containing protein [Prevotella sp.]
EVGRARDLNGTDVGVVRGSFGVAENACVWIPQQMKEKAVCFISENLVILLKKSEIVNNMHEAYQRLRAAGNSAAGLSDYGYGTFISGPSKTADIAQVLVMGAQAARSATVLLLDE